MLCESARQARRASAAAFGETTHLGRFIYPNGEQAQAEEDALQMSGSVTDLQNPLPFDERDHAHDPVLPAIERNGRSDQVVCKGEFVIKQAEKKPQDGLHKK